MHIFVSRVGPRPGTTVIQCFSEKFEHVKAHFLTHLLTTLKEVYFTAYICGSMLYLDITYNSVAHESLYHVDVSVEIETEYEGTIHKMRRLLGMILHDAVTPDYAPNAILLP